MKSTFDPRICLTILNEFPLLIFLQSNAQLFLSVHSYGTVPSHGFANRLGRNKRKAHKTLLRADYPFVYILAEYETFCTRGALPLQVKVIGPYNSLSNIYSRNLMTGMALSERPGSEASSFSSSLNRPAD